MNAKRSCRRIVVRLCAVSCLWPSSALAEPTSGALGSFSVSLSLVHAASQVERITSGFLLVNVPLERLAAPSRNELASPAQESFEEQPGQAAEAASAPPEAKPTQPAEQPPQLVLTAALVRATLKEAERASRRKQASERLDSLAARAKSSALLPELRLRAAHSTDESLRAAPTLDDPYRYTAAGGADLALEARATWRLDRLVFADEELSVERLRSESEKARQRLRERVLEKLFAWQRALLRASSPELEIEARHQAELAALEAEIELDTLTGGWFSALLAKAARAE